MIARGLRVTETYLLPTTNRHRPFLLSRVGILRRSLGTRTTSPELSKAGTTPRVFPTSLTRKSSSSSLVVILGAALAAAILLGPLFRQPEHSPDALTTSQDSTDLPAPQDPNSALPRAPPYSEMPIPPGHLGNLTPEQELKLRDFWTATLKTFGVKDSSPNPAALGTPATTPTTSEPNTDTESLKSSKKTNNSSSKKRHSLFSSSRKHHDDNTETNNSIPLGPGTGTGDADDKYGQTKEFQQTLKEVSPEELRTAFWSMVKSDHPDALLLRFLRARKWDVQRALVMLISTMRWRSKDIHVDDDIMWSGEGGALADSKSGSDSFAKKEGEDFLAQLRKGKSFLHGVDKEGRPLCYVCVRLHRPGEQSERAMERYTVFLIESARLVLRPPVETATILFDMSSFTLSNMDYAPLKFMIKIFEANYPESLGAVLVHKSPWVFQGIWTIVKGWLDPVVAAKVHFTKSVEDLEQFIPRSQIVKDLGGDEDWNYRYIEPIEGENDAMNDAESRQRLEEERSRDVLEFQKKTFAWIARASNEADAVQLAKERDLLAARLNRNYWQLDPFIRARSLYDRQGMIGPGGVVDFYPEQRKKGVVNGAMASDPNAGTDDVD
ncbi:hypothetical protein GJ744_002225 [Endocarpon pusillum]|uniref:CRAL-TRIO domain-containing protein n=1 Tax=Endocarpon pusillum TaxID=364733 RepID=A0A8H7AC57_9EURO|nr:hypothetical protein GJ744_002225 [Endocarpon pusillum]